MLTVLSPAKTLDFSKISRKIDFSVPVFIKEAEVLISILRKFNATDISSLMGISAKLSDLNFERFLKWNKDHTLQNSKQAVFAFNGDVYDGLDVQTISQERLAFLNRNTRILSGLYGVLKPLDIIQGYRLEMGIKLNNSKGSNLYDYWGNEIAQNINNSIEESDGEKVLINLASNEYYKAIKTKMLKYPVITPVFKEYKEGELKMISFFAKKARGLMARFIATENITKSLQIKMFNIAGYSYNEELSSENQWFFIR
jgi:cytoplasmic iron level regulating protein YaaA (DUF328/UPF0246 family)